MIVTSPGAVIDDARVIVPYTDLRDGVLGPLMDSRHVFELADVSWSDEAYALVFCGLWRSGESFAIVEHDIVIRPELLREFDTCPAPWCTAKYSYLRGNYWGLGATRFRSDLTRSLPTVPDEILAYDAPGHGPGHWCTLDMAVTSTLRAHGVEWPHVHGEVKHLSDGLPAHGCRT